MVKRTKKKPKAKHKPARASATAAATVLVLRTVSAGLTSWGGFQWPESGPVACEDWDPQPVCGGGLHGLLHGAGNGRLLDWAEGTKWQVVEVEASLVVEIDGGEKVKFPRGVVVFTGDRKGATELVASRAPAGTPIVGGTATAGDGGTATAGYGGTATAGARGTATAGDGGTATAGDGGTATAGDGGTATAGDGGFIAIEFYDSKRSIYRKRAAEVDGATIKPLVKYRLDLEGNFVEVPK
jgi:hypothetical protein